MKEIIVKYNDLKTLELLKSLSAYLGFTISEKKEEPQIPKKKVSFNAVKIDTRGFKFNRDEANER
ncbi:MAG: hypothetical protein MUF75_13570 [Bacteroidia bacterium]|jgi:hypothetical protein|nr:hypothetical protein [Bacteroidia bacterium]